MTEQKDLGRAVEEFAREKEIDIGYFSIKINKDVSYAVSKFVNTIEEARKKTADSKLIFGYEPSILYGL